jgi:hypothetical protein
MHKTTDRFWKCFYNLPENEQILAKENFELLKHNPMHHASECGDRLENVKYSLLKKPTSKL